MNIQSILNLMKPLSSTNNNERDYQLDLTKSNFYELIGFDKKIIKDKVNIGPIVPNLSQDTDILNIHCDW